MHNYKSKSPHFLVAALVSLCLAGCSSSPEKKYEKVATYRRVAIVQAADIPALEQLKGASEKVMESGGAGGTAGMAGGAAVGLACGPFAWLCSPMFAVAGGTIGGLTGMVHGAVDVSVSKADTQRVGESFSRVLGRRQLQEEFWESLSSEVPAQYQADPAQAKIFVSPVITAINIDEDSETSIHIHLDGMLLFSWSDSSGMSHLGREEFKVKSPSAPIDDWVADDARKFDEFLTFALAGMTAGMASYLEEHVATGVEQP